MSHNLVLDFSNPKKLISATQGTYFYRVGNDLFFLIKDSTRTRIEVSKKGFALKYQSESWYPTLQDFSITFKNKYELWKKTGSSYGYDGWTFISNEPFDLFIGTPITPTPTPTSTATPTSTPTPTSTATPIPPTDTPTPTPTSTATPTPTSTPTSTPTATPVPTNTPTTTPTSTPTATPVPPTATPTSTPTPTPSGPSASGAGSMSWPAVGNWLITYTSGSYSAGSWTFQFSNTTSNVGGSFESTVTYYYTGGPTTITVGFNPTYNTNPAYLGVSTVTYPGLYQIVMTPRASLIAAGASGTITIDIT